MDFVSYAYLIWVLYSKWALNMIKLPAYEKAFDYENNFYLSCKSARMAKSISQYKLFERTVDIEGDIVECGVFKGASLSRFSMYRKIHDIEHKKIIGFDSFYVFPETEYEKDQELRSFFISNSGDESISREQMHEVLLNKDCNNNVNLIEGDITETVPKFILNNPETKISFLNVDVDIYEPTVTILEYLFPLLTTGGIMILDDYKVFPGETNAVDEYFNDSGIVVKKPLFVNTPYYVIKQ